MQNKVVGFTGGNSGDTRRRYYLFRGIVENRRPMAAVCEIVRQQKRGLVLLGTCSIPGDILVVQDASVPTGVATARMELSAFRLT